jgi:hypothetical protein
MLAWRVWYWAGGKGLGAAAVPGWEGTLDYGERERVALYQVSCGSITVKYVSQLLDRVGIMG